MRRRRFLVGGLAGVVWTAGCGLVPEESDPIEASATAPATLPDAAAADAGYEQIVAETTTVETTVDTDISGDVELNASRDVVMTLFRRAYRANGGRRFGLVTAPTVRIIENSETRYDPAPALDPARVVALATDRSVDAVSDFAESRTVTLLGTETPRETATATDGDDELAVVRARARAGDDAVTAVALAPTTTRSLPSRSPRPPTPSSTPSTRSLATRSGGKMVSGRQRRPVVRTVPVSRRVAERGGNSRD